MVRRTLKLRVQDYFFETKIFNTTCILLLVTAAAIILRSGYGLSNHYYSRCDSPAGCENPLTTDFDHKVCGKIVPLEERVCQDVVLPLGFEYGIPPPWYVTGFKHLAFLAVIVAFAFNHFMYNRKFKFTTLVKEVIENAHKD